MVEREQEPESDDGAGPTPREGQGLSWVAYEAAVQRALDGGELYPDG